MTDDLLTLWGKGRKFIALNIFDMAATCFRLFFHVNDTEDEPLHVQKAIYFCDRVNMTGITKGVLVVDHEKNQPKQSVEIGDIIYGVNWYLIGTCKEYEECIVSDSIILNILRFSESGENFEILEIPYDKKKGSLHLWSLSE